MLSHNSTYTNSVVFVSLSLCVEKKTTYRNKVSTEFPGTQEKLCCFFELYAFIISKY